ncbi:Hemerythrin-like metal-binding protein [Paramagnetospirillum magnetotacticum MS-1]|uniref:Hemerythrin-like metal-binding protein n=1 Tax=Paramagnetospirillum magnetotacticum MS-1 TaxID=272627 RepID=A0A0C2V246_PARME|nr:hemerythrin family protein [Paramagnetospirillum magnetotacticum]KIL99131.1 Hemerythrin-like metal-binding protein [Paramagnetospirillum magnetotacticum MS-1]
MIARHAVIRWGEPLLLGVGFVDRDHCEAVEMINRLAAASGAERLELARAFAHHCAEHFAREEEMMVKTGFFALEPHRDEHMRVLGQLDEVIRSLEGGDSCAEYFAVDLPQWFLEHRATMDYVTSGFALDHGWVE